MWFGELLSGFWWVFFFFFLFPHLFFPTYIEKGLKNINYRTQHICVTQLVNSVLIHCLFQLKKKGYQMLCDVGQYSVIPHHIDVFHP